MEATLARGRGGRTTSATAWRLAALLLGLVIGASASASTAWGACTQFIPNTYSFVNGAKVETRPYGRGTTVKGLVSCEDGTRPTGGTVLMAENVFRPPDQLTTVGFQFVQLSPSSSGQFSFDIGPAYTRRLYFAYVAVPENGGYLSLGPDFLTFIQRVRPRLHVSPKRVGVGKATRFRGSLPGPFFSGRPVVALQARSGKKWRTFKVLPLSASGKFSGKYRFAATSRRTTYRFRAKPVIGGAEYRYEVRPSKIKRVTVVP